MIGDVSREQRVARCSFFVLLPKYGDAPAALPPLPSPVGLARLPAGTALLQRGRAFPGAPPADEARGSNLLRRPGAPPVQRLRKETCTRLSQCWSSGAWARRRARLGYRVGGGASVVRDPKSVYGLSTGFAGKFGSVTTATKNEKRAVRPGDWPHRSKLVTSSWT
jgi:hypothetical protein